jgi:hypothetical protein
LGDFVLKFLLSLSSVSRCHPILAVSFQEQVLPRNERFGSISDIYRCKGVSDFVASRSLGFAHVGRREADAP